MNHLRKEYTDSLVDLILKRGRLMCAFAILFISMFIYGDIVFLHITGIIKWRILAISLMTLYIIGSFTYLDKHRRYVIPCYKIVVSTIFSLLGAIIWYTLFCKTSMELKFAGTLGCISTLFCFPFIAIGISRYIIRFTIIWMICVIILAIYFSLEKEFPYISTILLVGVFAVLIVWYKDQLDFKNFKANKLLQMKEEELRMQNKRLETSNSLLSNFAHSASHDLKEPLRMITSFGKLIERKSGNKLDQDTKEYLEFMIDASYRMNRLIDDLMNFSKVRQTNFQEIESVDLNPVMDTVLSNLSLKIRENQAQVHTEKLPSVLGKSTMYVQLFQNLIANAIKFQPQNQQAIIHIQTKTEKPYHIISVSDNGIGMNLDQTKDIFETFTRLNPVSAYDGSGIGLATCKTIVEGFGGRIQVESTEGKGSMFTIYLNM